MMASKPSRVWIALSSFSTLLNYYIYSQNTNSIMTKKILLGLISFFVLLFPIEGQNLILNPSNDEELINGEIPSWQEIQGTQWTQRCASPDAYEGSCYFYAGAVALGKLQQTIDLNDYAANIDNGIQEFYFSGYVVSYQQSPADQSQIELRYFSETNELLEEEIFGPYNNTDAWMLVESEMLAPVGARSFTITLVSIRANGSNNDGYFDALNFVAIEQPIECTLELAMTSDFNVATLSAMGTGAENPQYIIDWGDDSPTEVGNNASHEYAEEGIFNVCITYSDLNNPESCVVEECTQVEITLPPDPCTLEINYTQEENLVTIEAIGTGAMSGSYAINWGDGSEVENSNAASHTYEPGEYTLCVTYFDVSPPMGKASGTQGCFMEECFDIVIEELPIECSVELTLVQNGNVVTATASGNGLTEEIYFINWGDGSLVTQASSGTHTYVEDGVYEICVTYQDDLIKPTCSATACEDVDIVTNGIDESDNNIAHLNVYPNPVGSNSVIVFSLNRSTKVFIDVVDVLGKSVQHIASSSYGQGTQRINWETQALASGVYFVRVNADNEQLNFRIIK